MCFALLVDTFAKKFRRFDDLNVAHANVGAYCARIDWRSMLSEHCSARIDTLRAPVFARSRAVRVIMISVFGQKKS